MRQPTFQDESFKRFRKPTRREKFLQEMEQIVPWKRLRKVIKPHYPKPGSPGRPAIGLDRITRLYFLQHWFNLSAPATEGEGPAAHDDMVNIYPAMSRWGLRDAYHKDAHHHCLEAPG